MKALGRTEIRGTWGTLLLPIGEADAIDFTRLAEELDALIASGVDGIYSNGTAGEFHTQTEDEFDRVQLAMAERCGPAGMPFQIGASHPSAQISLDRIRRTVSLAPSAFQAVLPDWYPVTLPEARAFLERMAEAAAPAGIVLYNPPHAKRVLHPAEWRELAAAVPALVGVKVAGGDDDWYSAMAATGLSVFVPGHLLAGGVARGAAGSYSNVACLHPRGSKRWYDRMHADPAGALELEGRIRRFMTECILPFRENGGYSNTALDKLLAATGGWAPVGTRLRWPYRWIDQAEADRLRPIARSMLPELFE